MIDKSLEVLKKIVQNYLLRLPELNLTNRDFIELSSVVNQEGKISIPENSLGITLVNVEEERHLKAQQATSVSPNGIVSHVNPEIKLNLYVLISANFKEYDTGLQYLSAVIRCFQSNNVFTTENTPEMDPVLQKLIAELYTLNFEQQNHLWGALGAKYIPSVLYKVRLVTIQEGIKTAESAPVISIKIQE